jgi:ribA/ribD-fused uncharacterized protein
MTNQPEAAFSDRQSVPVPNVADPHSDAYPRRQWQRSKCAVFRRTKGEFGELSNMTSGFPLELPGILAGSSEALYQALRFSYHPDIQEQILAADHPLASKRVSREHDEKSDPEWQRLRVEAMRWCLLVKTAQHWGQLLPVLIETGNRPIVEESRVDTFWGAISDSEDLVGCNVLGCLWTGIRDGVTTSVMPTLLIPALPDHFRLLGRSMPPIDRDE